MKSIPIILGFALLALCGTWEFVQADETPKGYSGIGIKFEIQDGRILVTKVLEGGPAERAGIHSNDRIVEVDGDPAPPGVRNDNVHTALRGPVGSVVQVTIERATSREKLHFSVQRKLQNVPVYSTRYVNGDLVQVGRCGGLEVRVATWKSNDLKVMLYVQNDSDHPVTFYPEQLTVDAVQTTEEGSKRVRVKTFSANEYEKKMNKSLAWKTLFFALGNASASEPQAETYQISGTSNSRYHAWGTGTSVSGTTDYSGTLTREPTDADWQESQARSMARTERTMAPQRALAQEIAAGLMRTQTVDPNTCYGGAVYAKKKGKDYAVTVPFGGTTFEFSFRFDR